MSNPFSDYTRKDNIRNGLYDGKDLEAVDGMGCTVLFTAVRCGQYEAVEELLNLGANINAVNDQNSTVLIWAVYSAVFNVVKLLLSRGVDINTVDKDGKTALFYAEERNQSDIANLIRTEALKRRSVGSLTKKVGGH